MQGQKAEESIIDALENIFDKLNDFDVVVIIRGGGSKAELSCFDNYRLAFHITQFPLPVLTGIGHERDESVVDIVAHAHLKTPTAVAEFLISRVSEFDLRIDDCSERLFSFISVSLNDESKKIENYSEKIIPLVKTVITAVKHDIEITKSDLTGSLQKFLSAQNRYIINYCSESKHAVTKNIIVGNQQIVVFARALLNDCHGLVLKKQHQMEMYHQAVNYVNPETILKRGYTITSLEGRIIKSVTALSAGEDVTTLFSDGSIESRINKVTSNK
jgi:exodeoxyribonuclease VII large subunit